jgi:hypothetical protein
MGHSRWSDDDWKGYSTKTAAKSTAEIFSKSCIDKGLDPLGIKLRESRDSAANPLSNAIIVGLDVTGSMGYVLDTMARQGLKTLVTEIYDRKPVTDPHIMCMGIGDCEAGDRAPLQATQFESDIRIATDLEKVYLEKGGGGNNFESYTLPWYFAALHTSIDCFEKRGKKGYLFTVGDEEAPPRLRASDIARVLGDKPQSDLSSQDLLATVSRTYEVFHVVVEEGSYFRQRPARVLASWGALLGQRVLRLADHTKLAEVIVSAIQITEGADAGRIAASWDGSTGVVVAEAVKGLTRGRVAAGAGPVRF